jgi:hypothetical protein
MTETFLGGKPVNAVAFVCIDADRLLTRPAYRCAFDGYLPKVRLVAHIGVNKKAAPTSGEKLRPGAAYGDSDRLETTETLPCSYSMPQFSSPHCNRVNVRSSVPMPIPASAIHRNKSIACPVSLMRNSNAISSALRLGNSQGSPEATLFFGYERNYVSAARVPRRFAKCHANPSLCAGNNPVPPNEERSRSC